MPGSADLVAVSARGPQDRATLDRVARHITLLKSALNLHVTYTDRVIQTTYQSFEIVLYIAFDFGQNEHLHYKSNTDVDFQTLTTSAIDVIRFTRLSRCENRPYRQSVWTNLRREQTEACIK